MTAAMRPAGPCSSMALPRLPKRLAFVSGTAVQGDFAGAWLAEDDPAEPDGVKGALLREAERRLAAGPVPTMLARLAGVYGARARVDAGAGSRRGVVPARGLDQSHPCPRRGAHAGAPRVRRHSICLGVDDAPASDGEAMAGPAAHLGLPPPPEDARFAPRGVAGPRQAAAVEPPPSGQRLSAGPPGLPGRLRRVDTGRRSVRLGAATQLCRGVC